MKRKKSEGIQGQNLSYLPSGEVVDHKNLQQNNKITTELAAQIVRDYILPMFESDEKRGIIQKQNKLHGIGKSKFMIKN